MQAVVVEAISRPRDTSRTFICSAVRTTYNHDRSLFVHRRRGDRLPQGSLHDEVGLNSSVRLRNKTNSAMGRRRARVDIRHMGVWATTKRRLDDPAKSRDAAARLNELGYGAAYLSDVGRAAVLNVVDQLQAAQRVAIETAAAKLRLRTMPSAGPQLRGRSDSGAAAHRTRTPPW
jgi:hypothetical protein